MLWEFLIRVNMISYYDIVYYQITWVYSQYITDIISELQSELKTAVVFQCQDSKHRWRDNVPWIELSEKVDLWFDSASFIYLLFARKISMNVTIMLFSRFFKTGNTSILSVAVSIFFSTHSPSSLNLLTSPDKFKREIFSLHFNRHSFITLHRS